MTLHHNEPRLRHMPALYVMRPDGGMFGTRWAYGEAYHPRFTDTGMPVCPMCGQRVGLLRWQEPHSLSLSSAQPRKWGDVLFGSDIGPMMASAKLKAVYEDTGLAGITLWHPPATLVRAAKTPASALESPPQYFAVDVEMLGPERDEAASRTLRAPPGPDSAPFCSYCHANGGYKLQSDGVFIKPETWHGEDVFIPRGGPTLVVTQTFVDIYTDAQLQGARFVPAALYAFDGVHGRGYYVRGEKSGR